MKKLTKGLMLMAVSVLALGLSGCGKKLPQLDTENPKSVVMYYAACLAQGQYDQADSIAKKDGSEIVKQLRSQPDSKQSKEMVAAFRKISESFDAVLKDTQEDGHRFTYHFNAKPIRKIGVRMEGGKYWVFDL